MHQVKENVENSVQTKKIFTLVQVCRGRKKFENHCCKLSVNCRIASEQKKLHHETMRLPKTSFLVLRRKRVDVVMMIYCFLHHKQLPLRNKIENLLLPRKILE